MISSFLAVFPNSILWYNTSEFLLIGSADSVPALSPERLAILSENERVSKDLEYAYWGGPEHWLNKPEMFLAGFLCGPEGLAKLAAGASTYSDDLPVLEYSVASTKEDPSPGPVIELVRLHGDGPGAILKTEIPEATAKTIAAMREQNLRSIIAHHLHRVYLRKKDPALLRRALEWNGDDVMISNDLGISLAMSGQIDEATTQFERTLAIEPNSADAHGYLGIALARQGEFVKAIPHFDAVVQLQPDSASAHYYLARALHANGYTGSAIPHFRDAIRLKPDWLEPLARLAWIRATHADASYRDGDDALLLATAGCKLTRYKHAEMLDVLAAAYAEQKLHEEAMATVSEAIRIARAAGQMGRVKAMGARRELYKMDLAYRQKPHASWVGSSASNAPAANW